MKRWILVAAAAVACGGGACRKEERGRDVAVVPDGRAPQPVGVTEEEEGKPGLEFSLAEGEAQAPPREAAAPARAEPLSEAETNAVLERLPPLPPPEERAFLVREGSLPAPRTGATVNEPFPPPRPAEAAAAPAAGPLAVERFAPEGDVPLAPHLSLTFSQPMVAVGGVADVAAQPVPVRVTPQPPGRWRWVGTQTLLFEPAAERFPMATEYRVEVPAGTKSSTGGTLENAASFGFRTPAPAVVASHPPDAPARRDVVMAAVFDQKIDPQAVLATVSVRAGGRPVALRPATAEEVAADEGAASLVESAGEGRWVAFRAVEPLPADTAVVVAVGPGTPSAEGPGRTAAAHEFRFRTYGPLRVTDHDCWPSVAQGCRPGSWWSVDFSNPVDARRFRKEMVRVAPELPGLRVSVDGATLRIDGRARADATYVVALAADLPDAFGQTLGAAPPLTFRTAPAEPALHRMGDVVVVLDPASAPRLAVYSVGHRSLHVRVHAVGPEDFRAFIVYAEARARPPRAWGEGPGEPPGREVQDTTVAVRGSPDEMVETDIDLSSALPDGLGHLLVDVEPSDGAGEVWANRPVVVWVQATRLAVDALVDGESLHAWVTSLDRGAPVDGAEVSLLPAGSSTRTAADGTARLDLGSGAALLLVARRGRDVAMLPASTSLWAWDHSAGWERREPGFEVVFYVFDDRKMYRPGEEVRVKGWLRGVGRGKGGDVGALPAQVERLSYELSDSRGNAIASGTADLGTLGGFDLRLALPATVNLGTARLALSTPLGQGHVHTFEVQEFRRPEFEVGVQASEGPHFCGGRADLAVTASYYAGGPLRGAETTWRVTALPGEYHPPGREGFHFGRWTPRWSLWDDDLGSGRDAEAVRVETWPGRTDGSGKHHLRIDFAEARPPYPTAVVAEATVMDVNRQAWSATANLLVHPAALCAGLRTERAFVERGQPLRVDAIVTDLDGGAAAGRPLAVRAVRLEWEQEEGEWREKEVAEQTCETTSAAEPVPCTFRTDEGGEYRITARVADDKGRPSETVLQTWVAGGRLPRRPGVEQEEVLLVPDREEYQPGETAEVLVLAPFAPAEGLLTLQRSGIVRSERFTMPERSHTLRVPIAEGFIPNIHVRVDLVGTAPRTNEAGEEDPRLPPRPAFAGGSVSLAVPPRSRTLALAVQPREERLDPGGSTEIAVQVRDAAGGPVAGAEVAVVVADEAVLALTGYRLPDPLGVFYERRQSMVRGDHLRRFVLLGLPEIAEEADDDEGGRGARGPAEAGRPPPSPTAEEPALGTVGRAGEAAAEPVRMRTEFAALALFAPSLITGADGTVRVPLRLPDSLTRYRIMAVAAAGTRQFGGGEAAVTARLPLMVRPSPPRFLNFGDRLELPVVLQNQTDEPLTVDVAVRAANAELTAGAGRRVAVPAADRVEVRFPAAAVRAGRALFQVGASSGRFADAAQFDLPVYTPATAEAFATYGQLDRGAAVQPVRAPADAFPEFGGLEVTTSSTALQALTDAVLYLVEYPFGCAEQVSSRLMGVAALRDVLAAFEAGGLPSREELEAAVERDVRTLVGLQNTDGGFAVWELGDESWPYVSIHAAHALERARSKGFTVPDAVLERSREYLAGIEQRIPAWYGEDVRRTLTAYALHVRHRLGASDPGRAASLLGEAGVENVSLEALGWILPVLSGRAGYSGQVEEIRRHLGNRAVETAGAAHFAVSYGEGDYLLFYSDRRADAVVLEALIGDSPDNSLIPKLVQGLLGQRKRGRWLNTQENVFILLALERYFATYEAETPDFVARAWLGGGFVGEQEFRGRTTERHHVAVPLEALDPARATDLLLAKDGPGRLYYRVGLRYAPRDLRLAPLDQGFVVERSYEAVDDPDDVRRDVDGTWHVRAGARVRVNLTFVARSRRYHVALVDPLPAGLEALNPALAVTGSVPAESSTVTEIGGPALGGPGGPGKWWWRTRSWYEHQNLRDERAEAFSSLLWEGVYSYSYVARATTPGEFVAPPARAEEMYAPETFGRGATDRVIVE